MSLFVRRFFVGMGQMVRSTANAGGYLARRVEEHVHSALTGVVVIGSRHLLGDFAFSVTDLDGDGLPGPPAEPDLSAGVLCPVWPDTAFEQIKAVNALLVASPGTLSALEIAGAFTGASFVTICRHLATLEAMGFALPSGRSGARRWHAASRAASAPFADPATRSALSVD